MIVSKFLSALYDCPVIASVKDEAGLERALHSPCAVVFLLFGSVVNAGDLTRRVGEAGKLSLIHLDLTDGLAQRESAVEFLSRDTAADGIITTRPQLARRAKELGLISVQRFFLLDSMAEENMRRQLEQDPCDLIEILPGAMPKVIRRLTAAVRKPVITGGLISDKEDVTAALSAGAVAISSTNPQIWAL